MDELLELLRGVLHRGEVLSPRDCLIAVACLTLMSYTALMLAGRARW